MAESRRRPRSAFSPFGLREPGESAREPAPGFCVSLVRAAQQRRRRFPSLADEWPLETVESALLPAVSLDGLPRVMNSSSPELPPRRLLRRPVPVARARASASSPSPHREIDRCSESSDDSSSITFVSQTHFRNVGKRVQGFFGAQQLCDVCLVCGETRIPAHRVILSGASDYLAAMFTGGMRETTVDEVEIQGMEPGALEVLINYCYSGELVVEESNVESLLSGACLMQLTEVVDACSAFLKTQLHPSNCLGIRSFADAQGCSKLQQTAQNYITNHFTEVIHQQEFLLLKPDELFQLLSSDDLNVPTEESVFHALCTWMKHDVGNRQKYAGKFMPCVRLQFLSPEFIADNVEKNGVFGEDPTCQQLVLEALKYHLLPERRASLQLGRKSLPRKSTVGTLFAVGGMDSSKGLMSIEAYSLLHDVWVPVGEMSGRRQQFGVAVIDRRIYVVGGRDGLKTLNSFEFWDPDTCEWHAMPPMSTGRHGLGVAVLGGPLYAVGGHDGWSYLATAERWDPDTRTWTSIAEMAAPRSTAGVTVLGGKLYAVGGRDSSQVLRSVEVYNPHTNKWTSVASMTRKRASIAVGVLHGCLYAVGGIESQYMASNPSSGRFDSVERFDPKLNTWTLVANLSVGRDGIGVAMFGDLLFATGGFDGQNHVSLVECYDPETNEWKRMSNLCAGRTGTSLVVIRPSPSSTQLFRFGSLCLATKNIRQAAAPPRSKKSDNSAIS